MEDFEDDILAQIDWNCIFEEFPEGTDFLATETPIAGDLSAPAAILDPSPPDSVSSWINEIENLLMKDDDSIENSVSDSTKELCDSFFADEPVDTPGNGSGEVLDAVIDLDSNASEDADLSNSDKEKVNGADATNETQDHPDDPISRKRRRQLRNRDAAVRSRERKKMYVRDLEMKSKYLEGECRRLGRLLQCCYAENHALRLSLQKGVAFGASMSEQESAVLLLESLLLGSLLWFMGIMCLFTLPTIILQSPTLEAVVLVLVGNMDKNPESRGLSGGGSNKCSRYMQLIQPFVFQSRRCKAARTKMRPSFQLLS